MAVPSKVKTWQYNLNSVQYGASALLTQQSVALQIKNAMKGFGTQPWTVVGGCNSFTVSFPGADRWSVTSDLVWANAGTAHSWVVLKQTGISGNFSVCFDLVGANTYAWNMVISPTVGFSGGTTLNRPTASDEIVITDNFAIAGNVANIVHAMQSTDGKCTRIVLCDQSYCHGIICFDAIQNPNASLSAPQAVYTSAVQNSAGWSPIHDTLSDHNSGNVLTRHSAANVTLLYGGYGYNSSYVGLNLAGSCPNSVNGEWPFLPIVYLGTPAAPPYGMVGTAFDMYWGTTNGGYGFIQPDYYATGANKSWAQFGHLILPWDGSSIKRMR
jgi:hypothetical protein